MSDSQMLDGLAVEHSETGGGPSDSEVQRSGIDEDAMGLENCKYRFSLRSLKPVPAVCEKAFSSI